MSVATPAVDWLTAAIADSTLPTPRKAGSTDRVFLGGLVFGQVYYFALRTADGDENWSAFSNVARVETADPAPPARVTDLRATDLAPHAVTLVFTAPGDDGFSGQAAEYALRISPSPITEATWEQAEPIPVTDPPQAARFQEHIRVTVLQPQTAVHLAIACAGRCRTVERGVERRGR